MNHDSISRDAVLDACSQSINILDAMSRIEDLPPVTPKQRTGHWIYQEGYVPYKWKCNQCSVEFKTDFNYCPHCGAQMVEPQESEEGES